MKTILFAAVLIISAQFPAFSAEFSEIQKNAVSAAMKARENCFSAAFISVTNKANFADALNSDSKADILHHEKPVYFSSAVFSKKLGEISVADCPFVFKTAWNGYRLAWQEFNRSKPSALTLAKSVLKASPVEVALTVENAASRQTAAKADLMKASKQLASAAGEVLSGKDAAQ